MTDERPAAPRVLVVEDEALIRWSIHTRLDRDGFRVDLAENGARALERLVEPVDLVLLDLRLPDADGLSILAEIRRRCPSCRVIVMTAYGDPGLEERAVALGALCVLKKPFDLEYLTARVAGAVAPRTAARSFRESAGLGGEPAHEPS
jgi:DNA-binding NtrC family response regulator